MNRLASAIVSFVASDSPLWAPQLAAIVTGILAIPTIGTFLNTLSKDRGVQAQRTRVLERAKGRMDVWRIRLDIQEKTLAPDKLESAKEETNEAIEIIRKETNENLIILAHSGRPTPVIGVPRWRKLLLLYEPIGGNVVMWHIERVLYFVTLLQLLLYLCLPFYLTYVYLNQPKANRTADWNSAFHSRVGHATWMSIGISFVGALIEAALVFNAARQVMSWPRVKEIDRI